jgi:hypothetical protein
MFFKKLIRYFFLPIYRPCNGINDLISERYKIVYSILVFLFLGIIYTISVQIAYSKGLGAAVKPFINIPAENYYYWQRFYQIPFFFLASILFAGTASLMSIPFKGRGDFIDIFCLLSISLTFPMFLTMWLPETINFIFFPGKTIIPLWFDVGRQIAGILWPLVISVIGISIIEKIRWYFSIIVVTVAAIPMTAMMVIFIR